LESWRHIFIVFGSSLKVFIIGPIQIVDLGFPEDFEQQVSASPQQRVKGIRQSPGSKSPKVETIKDPGTIAHKR
jgi:hypothetical protein